VQSLTQRKRLGIYYTPPEFARFVAERTIAGRISNATFEALRDIRVCDPACGDGALLIAAYDVLYAAYTAAVEHFSRHDAQAAAEFAEAVPRIILSENLYGVDVSPQAVALARQALCEHASAGGLDLPGELPQEIVCGNSLVSDPGVDPLAVQWEKVFPTVFGRPDSPGFDCVVGNPPWERLKLQEREFFAFSAPEIAGAVSAAQRRSLIEALQRSNGELYAQYVEAKDLADRTLAHVRACDRFPLTAKGDINTYMLFAELARRIVAPNGRVGLLVPSGIATDNTTKEFFGELMQSHALISLHDFENKAPFFPDVHRSFKFCTLVFGGSQVQSPGADFVFFARQMSDLEERKRHIRLSIKDLELFNPNTHTCPVFRSRRDADLTKAIYRRVPILIDRTRKKGGNPWGIKFVRMFDQTNDAELFRTREELAEMGCKQEGNRWRKGKRVFLPLYEAKMVQAYDHRAAGVIVESANWVRQGQTDPTSPVAHQNPEFVVQPRWWVEGSEVDRALAGQVRPFYLCYKDVTSPTNQRTMIAAVIPHAAVVNSAPLVLTGEEIAARQACCLLANLPSVALDFVARQKVGGLHLNFFIVNQLPVFAPDRYAERCPWQKRQTLERWISDRVLNLTCTAEDMHPLAEAAGFDPPVHKWNANERAELMAELDAAFFLLYGIDREDVEYILGTFAGAAADEDATAALLPADDRIQEAYDRLARC